jgi:hypothetical protein
MFAAAPLIGALCPVINEATAGGTLDGVLPDGATQKLSEGFAGVAAGTQARINGVLAGLRGRGLGVDLSEESVGGGLFKGGLAGPSHFVLGGLGGELARVAGLAKQGMAG